MISIGVDAHKSTHLAVALDAAGQVCGQWQGANSTDGWADIHAWAKGLSAERQWGIEGAWNYGRGLAQHLVAADEAVYDINARWTAALAAAGAQPQQERSARCPGSCPLPPP